MPVTARDTQDQQQERYRKLEKDQRKDMNDDAKNSGLDETDNGHGNCVMCTHEPPKPTPTPPPTPPHSPTPVPVPIPYPYPWPTPIPLHPDGYAYSPRHTYLPIYYNKWNDVGIVEPISHHDGDYVSLGDDSIGVTISNEGDYPSSVDVDFTLERWEPVENVIMYEGFESGIFPPTGWLVHHTPPPGTDWMQTTNPYVGSYAAGLEPWPMFVYYEWMTTPAYDLSLADSPCLSFYYSTDITDPEMSLQVWASTEGQYPGYFDTLLYDEIISEDIDHNNYNNPVEINLASYGLEGETVYIGFKIEGMTVQEDKSVNIDEIRLTGITDGWQEIFTVGDGPYDLDPDVWIESFFDISYDTEGFYRATFSLDTPSNKSGRGSWSDDYPENDEYHATYTVLDDDFPPMIFNVTDEPDPQQMGGYVNISCNVTDDEGVADVQVRITCPDVSYVIETMINIFNTEKYYYNATYDLPGEYDYYIWAQDIVGNENTSDIYTFTIINNAPYQPSNPSPENGEIDVNIETDLSWTGGDPDPGDTVTYDVYLDATSPPTTKVSNNQTGTIYDPPSELNYDETYYWIIVAWDTHGASTNGDEWHFTTESTPNNPPNLPSDPDPSNGETDVDVDYDLSWTCSDPDGDDLTYDVYFEAGDSTPDVLVSNDQTETTFDPGTLDYDTIYYWQIIAEDEYGATTDGPIWHFATEEEPVYEPDLDCSGTLSWTGVTPGDTVSGSITVENIGDPESLLDWEIESYPDWGTWTFDPDSGTDLGEGDMVTIDVEVVAPDEQEETFAGEVVLVNSKDPDDTCSIDVSLATPVNQQVDIHPLFQRILDRFPNIFPILKTFLGL